MKLSEIRISNFRCFGPEAVTIELSDATCLVGTNGSGKSAVLVALSKLFGLSGAERALAKSDFHVAQDENEDVTERSLWIEARITFPELKGKNQAKSRAIPECFNQMIIEDVGSDPYCRIRLDAKWAATNISEGDIEQNIFWITSPSEDIDNHKMTMTPQQRSLIHAIYVPAARDPSKQLRSTRSSVLARLLKSIGWSASIRSTLKESAEKILKAFDDEVAIQEVTESIRDNWKELQSLSSFENPTLRPLSPEFETLIRNLEFVFNPADQEANEQTERLSEGLQSLFYLALVGMMFDLEENLLEKAAQEEMEGASDENDDEEEEQEEGESVGISLERLDPPALVLLGVEEPENHLAPHYLGRIMERLLRLSKSTRGQVLLTSHSPSIMSRVEPTGVRYLRLNPDKETIVRKILLPPHGDEAFKYINEGVRAYPEMYFSTLVVLGEGDSERLVLPRAASALGAPMDRNFVSFVPLGGRHVNHLWKLLSDLDIPYVTLLDLDLEREGGGWGRIKYACKELLKLGIKPKDLLQVTDGSGASTVLSSSELEGMHTWAMNGRDDLKLLKAWANRLEQFGVFFSYPLDLDFAMLTHFPDAYQATPGDGKGPSIPEKGTKEYQEKLGAAREAVLRGEASKGIVDLFSNETLFFWYRYLFLNRGKPSTHFQALSSITDEQLVSNIPKVIQRLVGKMINKLEEHL